MDIREYQYFRTRWELAGSGTDYRIAEGSEIHLRALYSDFERTMATGGPSTLVDNTPGIQLLNPSNSGRAKD